jgi:hypothetical protein
MVGSAARLRRARPRRMPRRVQLLRGESVARAIRDYAVCVFRH